MRLGGWLSLFLFCLTSCLNNNTKGNSLQSSLDGGSAEAETTLDNNTLDLPANDTNRVEEDSLDTRVEDENDVKLNAISSMPLWQLIASLEIITPEKLALLELDLDDSTNNAVIKWSEVEYSFDIELDEEDESKDTANKLINIFDKDLKILKKFLCSTTLCELTFKAGYQISDEHLSFINDEFPELTADNLKASLTPEKKQAIAEAKAADTDKLPTDTTTATTGNSPNCQPLTAQLSKIQLELNEINNLIVNLLNARTTAVKAWKLYYEVKFSAYSSINQLSEDIDLYQNVLKARNGVITHNMRIRSCGRGMTDYYYCPAGARWERSHVTKYIASLKRLRDDQQRKMEAEITKNNNINQASVNTVTQQRTAKEAEYASISSQLQACKSP